MSKHYRFAKPLLCAGLVLALAGLVLMAGGPPLIRYFATTQVSLVSPGTPSFDGWQNSSYGGSRVRRHYYFFNLTNPLGVHLHHARPRFERVGPFVYDEQVLAPLDEVFWFSNATVGYRYEHRMVFNGDLSVDYRTGRRLDPMEVNVTLPNPALSALTWRMGRMPEGMDILGLLSLNKTAACDVVDLATNTIVGSDTASIYTSRSVHEFLWGYEDPLLSLFKKLSKADDGYFSPTEFRFQFNGSTPAPSPYTGVKGQMCPSWDDISACNGTLNRDSHAAVGADWGQPNPSGTPPGADSTERATYHNANSRVGSIQQWAGQSEMWWWGEPGDDCRRFEGSLATLFPPNLDRKAEPYAFVDALYQKSRLAFHRDVTVSGLPAYEFRAAPADLAASAYNWRCYGMRYHGLLNATAPLFAPIFTTGPYFLDYGKQQRLAEPIFRYPGDRRLALNATVVHPVTGAETDDWGAVTEGQDATFETHANIYPPTGTIVSGAARIQTNTWLGPVTVDGCPNIFKAMHPRPIVDNATNATVGMSYYPETLAPLFYVDRDAAVGEHVLAAMRREVRDPLMAATVGGAVFLGGGALLFAAGLLVAWRRHVHHKHHPHHGRTLVAAESLDQGLLGTAVADHLGVAHIARQSVSQSRSSSFAFPPAIQQ